MYAGEQSARGRDFEQPRTWNRLFALRSRLPGRKAKIRPASCSVPHRRAGYLADPDEIPDAERNCRFRKDAMTLHTLRNRCRSLLSGQSRYRYAIRENLTHCQVFMARPRLSKQRTLVKRSLSWAAKLMLARSARAQA